MHHLCGPKCNDFKVRSPHKFGCDPRWLLSQLFDIYLHLSCDEFAAAIVADILENCAKYSMVGCQFHAKNVLERLHQPKKLVSISDQLMVSRQKVAFENVRMKHLGERAQTIRQLLSTNLVRRVALFFLSTPHGKRQHLAVSHEKVKVTILLLSALLNQADAVKRKLISSRISSEPIPCISTSLASNHFSLINTHPTGIILQRPGYYTIPSLEKLRDFMTEDGKCVVPNFTVGRKGYGNVYFGEKIDVAGLNLDELVHIRHKEVIIYADDANKPPVGESLNRKAQVTLDQVRPYDKTLPEHIERKHPNEEYPAQRMVFSSKRKKLK